MIVTNSVKNDKSKQTFGKIRETFEHHLPGMFKGSDTILHSLLRMEGSVPPGVTNRHFKAYETASGEPAFRALVHAATEVTKTGKFRPKDIIDAIEDWLMDKQFISPGGGAGHFCGHLWLLVAVEGSLKKGAPVKFLEHLARDNGLDWKARWVAVAALIERSKNDGLPYPDLGTLHTESGFDRYFSGTPQIFQRYHARGGYGNSLERHRTLIREEKRKT